MPEARDVAGPPDPRRPAPSPGPLPLRLLHVFVAPGQLFAALREEPRWLGATLLGAALVVLSAILVPADVWNEMFREQMLQSGQEVPQAFDFGTLQRVLALVGGPVSWFLWILFLSGVLAVVFAFVLGDDGRFRQYLAVTAHALLIPAVGGLATVPLRLAERDPMLTLDLGLFAGLEEGYLMTLLTMLDIFLLWSYVVMGVGVHEIDRRRSWASASAILLVLAVGMAAGMAAIVPR